MWLPSPPIWLTCSSGSTPWSEIRISFPPVNALRHRGGLGWLLRQITSSTSPVRVASSAFVLSTGGDSFLLSHPVDTIVDMEMNTTMVNCFDCKMRDSDHCSDCLVTFLCGRDEDDALIVDAAEVRAVRMLVKAGLVSDLRYEPRAG